MASARAAVVLSYAIVPDDGPSGKLGHWAVALRIGRLDLLRGRVDVVEACPR